MTRRYIITLCALLIGFSAAWNHTAQAVTIEAYYDSFDSEQTAEERCKDQNLVQGIERGIEGARALHRADLKAELKNTAKEFASELIKCVAGGLIKLALATVGASDAWPDIDCVDVAKERTSSTILANELQRTRAAFEDSCHQSAITEQIIGMVQQTVQENGRDGGAAFVQDYRDLAEGAQYRGLQIAKNQMANTNYCPWNRDILQSVFGFGAGGGAVVRDYADGQTSYTQSAGCTLPIGFDPTKLESQTLAAYAALSLPQNSLAGSYLLAKENIQLQKAAEQAADDREFQSGYGGLRHIDPETGSACEVWNTERTACLQYKPIVQPGAGVKSFVDSSTDALIRLAERDGVNTVSAVATSLLDATNQAVKININIPISLRKATERAAQIPPENPNTPENLACTGGNPQCICVSDDPAYESLRQLVALATTQAVQEHPELVTPDGGRVLPGANADFLNAVCSVQSMRSLNCHVIQEDEIAIDIEGAGTVSLDLITGGENGIRIPGQTVALCQPGVQ